MSERFTRVTARSILLAAALGLWFPAGLAAAPRDCDGETDTGSRMKCKMQNLSGAFGGFVATVAGDDTGTFSDKQKKQFEDMRDQVRNEAERTPPEDFKQMGKKRELACRVQEILGDVSEEDDKNGNGECDNNERCIGNEDGTCDQDERSKGGCAEALDDGIGDDDGVCETKDRFEEKCLEVCDTDTLMAEGDETNVDQGRAAEMERALVDATDIVDESSAAVRAFVQARSGAVAGASACDQATLGPCPYLACLLDEQRSASLETIENLAIASVSLQAVTDLCRDVSDQSIPLPFVGGSLDVYIVCLPLGLAANTVSTIASLVEVVDDSETAERLDATALCAKSLGDEIEAVNELVETTLLLLRQPQGRRPGFPRKDSGTGE
jgi:hypothetical protein